MTITGALNNAISGLRAAGRASQIVSSNLSNALTPGYARRSLELSASTYGSNGGVQIDGQVRHVNEAVVADRQQAGAAMGNRSETLAFVTELERLLGTPDQSNSLAGRLAGLESSLVVAASRPDAIDRLGSAVTSAQDLISTITTAASGIQELRSRADQSIDVQVNRLNDALQELQELNQQITSAGAQGGDDASLRDHRQLLVDEISEMVPVRTVPRPNGAIALYSEGGVGLLDGSAAEIKFDPVNLVASGMSIDTGVLSGLTVNDRPLNTTSDRGALRGGTLSAQFEIRDELAVEAEENLDTITRDLIERFQDDGADPTLAAGEPSLFTDDGAFFDPANEAGISSRLSLNTRVDPDQGGAVWRMRDGIGATLPGDVGDATILQSLGDALTGGRAPGSGPFGTGTYDASGLTTAMMSQIANDRVSSEQRLSFSATVYNELSDQLMTDGVDSDAELQRLIVIEQTYAANVRMLQTVDELLQSLLRI